MAGSQDPNDYTATLFARGYLPLKREVMRLVTKWRADPDRRGQAAFLEGEWRRFERRLLDVARRTAQEAEQEIKLEEEASRVRDDTGGGGGPRLNDHLGQSTPVFELPGSVLINDERALDEAGVDWWWTNEEGYSGHIGREIRGVFMPGGARPDPSRFREHPLFQPMAKGPKGEIKNPIPERRFVQSGYNQVRGDWHAEIQAAEQTFIDALRRAQLSVQQAASKRRAANVRRGRGRP
jgi:hypothetical protein